MKIAVIWSSPNTDGMKAAAKNNFLVSLQIAGAEIDEIHLNKLQIEHCAACGNGWRSCANEFDMQY